MDAKVARFASTTAIEYLHVPQRDRGRRLGGEMSGEVGRVAPVAYIRTLKL